MLIPAMGHTKGIRLTLTDDMRRSATVPELTSAVTHLGQKQLVQVVRRPSGQRQNLR